MTRIITIITPKTCRLTTCPYNLIAPAAGSQECIGCRWLTKPKGKR